jgi:hypothetical protein
MKEFSDFKVYQVKDTPISMTTSETEYGWHTIAEVNRHYHYLGDQLFNIATAIALWEKLNGKTLTSLEVEQTMIENGMKSDAV